MTYDLCSDSQIPDRCADPALPSYVPNTVSPNIPALANAARKFLPSGPWALKPEPPDPGESEYEAKARRTRAELTNADGARIYLRYDTYKKRVHVGCTLPDDGHGNRFGPPYGKQVPSITVSPMKTAEAVANDIRRRVLPEYLPMYAEAAEKKRNWVAMVNDDAAFAARLGEALGVKPWRANGGYSDEWRVGDFKIAHGGVRADLSLSHEDALKVARLLREGGAR